MKKLAVLVALSGACAVAHAADEGWVDGADANGASGWACDSAWPYHQEYVHVYRDDGPFLGAIYAGNVREQAVGNRCGGHSHHGFSGPLSYPSNLGSMPFRVELDNLKDTDVPIHPPAASPVATD